MSHALLSPAGSKVRVLEVDPDLGAGVAADEASIAWNRVCARTDVLEVGPWAPDPARRPLLGLLVVEGLICRSVEMIDRSSMELLGAGDVVRPWQQGGEDAVLPSRAAWRVVERASVAILDERFARSIAPWPQIFGELLDRTIRRSRSQAVFATISHMTRVDVRIMLALWHFAERWGRVTPEGVAIRLPLTHEALGTLVGARRPSVTTALGSLTDEGLIRPLFRGEWLLTHRASARVEAIAAAGIRLAA